MHDDVARVLTSARRPPSAGGFVNCTKSSRRRLRAAACDERAVRPWIRATVSRYMSAMRASSTPAAPVNTPVRSTASAAGSHAACPSSAPSCAATASSAAASSSEPSSASAAPRSRRRSSASSARSTSSSRRGSIERGGTHDSAAWGMAACANGELMELRLRHSPLLATQHPLLHPRGFFIGADDAYSCGHHVVTPWPGAQIFGSKDSFNFCVRLSGPPGDPGAARE